MEWPDSIAVFYLILGVVLLWLGAVIIRENPRNRVNRITAFMLFFAGLGPIFAAIGNVAGDSWQATAYTETGGLPHNLFYVWELFFPQLLLFSLAFPREHAWFARFRRSQYLIFLPHLFHVLWLAFAIRPDPYQFFVQSDSEVIQTLLAPANLVLRAIGFGLTSLFEIHLKFFSVVNLLYIVLALWALQRGFRTLTNPRLRDQVRIIVFGILSGVGLYSLAFIAPTLGLFQLDDTLRVGLAMLALLVVAASIGWSIIRYQFLDVRLVVRQSVVFTISSGLLVGAYVLLLPYASSVIKRLLDVQSNLIDAAFILLLLILFQPIKSRIDDWIARFFLRDEADPRSILESFSRQIASVFEMEDLKARVTSVVTEQLFVARAFFAQRGKNQSFSLELHGLRDQSIPAGDALFVEASERVRPTPFEEFVIDKPLTAMTEILSLWGCRLVVPIIDRGELTAVLFLGDKISGYRYTVEDVNLLATLANQMAVALTNVGLYQEALERQRLEDEMHVARKIQLRLLPSEPPSGASFQVAAFAQPSRQVGGDYYDFFSLPDGRLGLVIADVSGKGLGAALLVSQLQAILKSEVRNFRSAAEHVANANSLVADSTSADQFVTMVFAALDTENHVLEYTNAGHNYPVVTRADGTHEFLERGGLIVGAFRSASYEVGTVQLTPDDTVLFYTDGLSDLEDRQGNDFGEDRILDLSRKHRHMTADGFKNELVREATEFSEGELGFDDLTLVVLKILRPPGWKRPS